MLALGPTKRSSRRVTAISNCRRCLRRVQMLSATHSKHRPTSNAIGVSTPIRGYASVDADRVQSTSYPRILVVEASPGKETRRRIRWRFNGAAPAHARCRGGARYGAHQGLANARQLSSCYRGSRQSLANKNVTWRRSVEPPSVCRRGWLRGTTILESVPSMPSHLRQLLGAGRHAWQEMQDSPHAGGSARKGGRTIASLISCKDNYNTDYNTALLACTVPNTLLNEYGPLVLCSGSNQLDSLGELGPAPCWL